MKYIYLFLLPIFLFGDFEVVKTPKGKKRKIRVVRKFKKVKMVDIKDYIPDAIVDLKYRKRGTILRKRMYKTNICFVKKALAIRLKKADRILKKRYKKRIKFLDCYRPWSVQRRKWKKYPNKKYVDHPFYGSKHNRAAAVDITLVTLKNKKVKMPTKYDYFGKKAWSNYKKISKKAKKNRNILKRIMRRVGLVSSKRKWWHYSLRYTKRYPILDITFEDYIRAKNEFEKKKMFKNNKKKNRYTESYSFGKNQKKRDYKDEIQKGINSIKTDITNCFIKEFSRGVELPTELTISYIVRQNGRVYNVVIQHPKYKNKEDKLNYCVLKLFNSLKFKRFPKSTIGHMPLEFLFE